MSKKRQQGEKLRKIMEDYNINVPTLHRKTGIPLTTLYDWVNGRVIPNVETAKKVAEELNVFIDDIVD